MATDSAAFGKDHWEAVLAELKGDGLEVGLEWWESNRDDLVAVPEQYVRSLISIGDRKNAYALAATRLEHRDLWTALRAETTAQLKGALARRVKLLRAFRTAGEATAAVLRKAVQTALGVRL